MNHISSQARVAIFGVLLGFTLSRLGFSDYGEVSRMFTLTDFRLLFSFAGAVALLVGALALVTRRYALSPKPMHRGTVPGGILFGVGWALTGSCPSVPLVQLGEGRLLALVSLAGIVAGMVAFRLLRPRYFRWDTGSCG